jgi:hypothetical protein
MHIGRQSTMAHPFPRLPIRRLLAQNREPWLQCKNQLQHQLHGQTALDLCRHLSGRRALYVFDGPGGPETVA